MNDGVDEPTGKGTSRIAPRYYTNGYGLAGSRQESALLKSLLGPSLGVTAADVPDLGVLLVGPMARGAEVSLR
jgi:phospholipid/cholesterol/gamma-HCH transport system substrate-binding protein